MDQFDRTVSEPFRMGVADNESALGQELRSQEQAYRAHHPQDKPVSDWSGLAQVTFDGVIQAIEKYKSPLQKKVEAFEKQHKVQVTEQSGHFVYRMHVNGQNRELFRTAASEAGVDDAESKLGDLVATEQKQLEARYSVAFATPGEDVERQKEASYSKPSDVMVKSRPPELFELEGIKAALSKSEPSNIGRDGRGVKFYFLTDRTVTGINSIATFQSDKDNRASVYIWPEASAVQCITEKDLTPEQNKLPYTDRERPDSMEGAIIHELGHNQFAKNGYDSRVNLSEVDREMSPAGKALAVKMGWVRRLDEKDADYNWFLVGKSKDADGHPASWMPYFNGLVMTYTRRQKTGGLVDANGKVVPADKAQTIGEDAMRTEAVVTPASWYFEAPEEEYAESVRMFRLGASTRKALEHTSPALYQIIKENDEREINAAYGFDADKRAKKVRSIDGSLVDNTEAARRAIKDFESHPS